MGDQGVVLEYGAFLKGLDDELTQAVEAQRAFLEGFEKSGNEQVLAKACASIIGRLVTWQAIVRQRRYWFSDDSRA